MTRPLVLRSFHWPQYAFPIASNGVVKPCRVKTTFGRDVRGLGQKLSSMM